jgi:hypothetical protein
LLQLQGLSLTFWWTAQAVGLAGDMYVLVTHNFLAATPCQELVLGLIFFDDTDQYQAASQALELYYRTNILAIVAFLVGLRSCCPAAPVSILTICVDRVC